MNPARNLSWVLLGDPGDDGDGLKPRAWRSLNLCKWRTVNSKTSAFSNLVKFSPSDARAELINSLSSSRHRLIRARRLRSSIGFITLKKKEKFSLGCSLFGSDKMESISIKMFGSKTWKVNTPCGTGKSSRWAALLLRCSKRWRPFCVLEKWKIHLEEIGKIVRERVRQTLRTVRHEDEQ